MFPFPRRIGRLILSFAPSPACGGWLGWGRRGKVGMGACGLGHGAGNRLAAKRLLHQPAQFAQHRRHALNRVRRERRLALARRVQDGFQPVRGCLDLGQPQHARRTLQAVGFAEHLFQQRLVGWGFLQTQQAIVELGEMLRAFRLE